MQYSEDELPMSALGQKRTSRNVRSIPALPPKADIGTQSRNVRFVPTSSCFEYGRTDTRSNSLFGRDVIGVAFSMAFTVTRETLGLAIGPVSEEANDVHEALSKAP